MLSIDEHHLDRECVNLPSQYYQAAYVAGETERDINELNAQLEIVEAEFHIKIRQSPGTFGFDDKKPSEGAIKEITALNPKVIELSRKLRALAHKHEMEKILVAGFGYKKTSLSNLVELHSAGYHATVKPSGEGKVLLQSISRERVSRPLPLKNK